MNDFATWLEQLPHAQVDEYLKRLETQRANLDAEIEICRLALTLARKVLLTVEGPASEDSGKLESAKADRTLPPSEAIIYAMSVDPDRIWSFGELMDALVKKGWAGHTPSEQKRIQVAAMRLATKGDIVRPERGRYRLA
jgi:hypothetical protein